MKQARTRHEPTQRYGKPVNILHQLNDFYKTVKKYDKDDIISIDETSLNSFMIRNYCRSEIGKRCIIKTHSQEVFKKYTGIFAITTEGCIGYHVYEKGGINSDRLLEFLNKYVLNNVKGKVILLDNASSHRNPEVKQNISDKNHLLYSIPYQHYTNPIEMFFSILKPHIKKDKPIGRQEILNAIQNALQKIPKTYYRKLFNNAFDRLGKYKKVIKSSKERKLKNYKRSAF